MARSLVVARWNDVGAFKLLTHAPAEVVLFLDPEQLWIVLMLVLLSLLLDTDSFMPAHRGVLIVRVGLNLTPVTAQVRSLATLPFRAPVDRAVLGEG